jgi:FG-GAP-like repeat
MKRFPVLAALAAVSFGAAHAEEYVVHTWKKQQLIGEFWAEGAYFGDFNKDGENDIVYGPYWWAGPDFTQRFEYAPATQSFQRKKDDGSEAKVGGFDPLGYSRNFLEYTYDFNSDGWTDILILGFPGEESSWYENPKGREGHWQKHIAIEVTDNESPTLGDITGDGKPEIICSSAGYYGYATPDWAKPGRPFTFHRISHNGGWHKFTHGIGFGDVNGDGKKDLLEKDGWWEQPVSLEGDPVWKKHAFPFSQQGGSQMFAYDVDGDGLNDVITSVFAHGYGLVWWKQLKKDGAISFESQRILGSEVSENKYGVRFSQLHAVDLMDIDGDGLKDIVTGKRWWAHGPKGDVEPNAEPVLYWFKLTRSKGVVDFVPYRIDNDSGVGTQVAAGLITKDTLPDVVVGNKKGAYVFRHEAKKVSKAEYDKAQPVPLVSSK